jgi:DDE superfamily endonuclease
MKTISPTNKQELFNLRHASARNVIERIFGVLKRRFKILVYPPELSMNLQARIPAALAAIHNFIRDIDPDDLNDFDETQDIQPGWRSGILANGFPDQGERNRTNDRRDHIANDMWAQYQQHIAQHQQYMAEEMDMY